MNFKHLVLSALLLASSSIHAGDTIGWGNGPSYPPSPSYPPQTPSFPSQQPSYPSYPSYPSSPSQPSDPSFPGTISIGNDPWGNSSQPRIVEENVQSYFQSDDVLNLLEDPYIEMQLQGQQIRDITVITSSEDGNGLATMVLNGQSIESSKQVSRLLAPLSFRVDPFSNVAGRSLLSAQLYMRGDFYVEKVIFNLLSSNSPSGPGPCPPPHGQPQGPQIEVVRQPISQQIQQEGGLDLNRVFNLLMTRQGQVIRRVNVVARGNGSASLLVNNQAVSYAQGIGYNSSRLSFDLNPRSSVGREIQALKLYFRGNIIIDEVSIEVESLQPINQGGFGYDDHQHHDNHGDFGHNNNGFEGPRHR